MKIVVAALLLVALFTSAATVAYYVSVNNGYQQKNTVATVAPTPTTTPVHFPTASPVPTIVPAPPPNLININISTWNGSSDSNESLVIIDSPTNNAVYSTHSLTLTVHAGAPSWSYMIDLSLRVDWLENHQRLFYHMDYWSKQFFITGGITVTATLTDIPEGNHTIVVTANEYTSIQGSSSVNFTIRS